MKLAINSARWLGAAIGPTVLFLLLTRPVKHPPPKPVPWPDGSAPVGTP